MPSLREIMLNRAKEPAKARAQLCQRCHPSNLLCSSCLFSHWVQHLFQLQHIMYRFSPCKTAQEPSYLLLNEKNINTLCFNMFYNVCRIATLQICSTVASVFSTGSSHGPGAANSIDSSWHSKGSNARGDAAEEWLWTPSTARNLVTGCFRNSLPKKFKESMNLVRITRDLSWFTVLEIIFLGFNFFWPIPHLVPFLPLTKAQSDRRTPSQPRKRRVNEAQKAMKKGRDETNICELSLLRNGLLLEFLTSWDPFEWKDHTRNGSENPQDPMGPSIAFPFWFAHWWCDGEAKRGAPTQGKSWPGNTSERHATVGGGKVSVSVGAHYWPYS